MSQTEKDVNKTSHEEHSKNKDLARKHRDEAKKKAQEGKEHFLGSDLEAVCYCPSTNTKALFYKRRLALYNFTVLDLGSNNVHCYCWHEGLAKRGSSEVGSCLFHIIQNIADGKEITFMSDTCGGQNRNVNIAALLMYCVQSFDIPVINHKFFESGHSQMEVDSVQTERKKCAADIFDPSGFYTLIRLVWKNNSFKVIEMDQDRFLDFTQLRKVMVKNRKTDTSGEEVNWLKIKWLQFRKTGQEHIYFKYALYDEVLKKIKVIRKGHHAPLNDLELKPSYHGLIPISTDKYNDLIDLCDSGIIRAQYHPFYQMLQHGAVTDCTSDAGE